MTTPHPIASVRPVDNEERGARFEARREKIGISKSALARRAGVSRGSVLKLESGEKVDYEVVGSIDKALSDLEHKYQMDRPSQVAPLRPIGDPDEGMVEFEITGNFGVKAVVKGPVSNMAELQEAARRLIADMGGGHPQG